MRPKNKLLSIIISKLFLSIESHFIIRIKDYSNGEGILNVIVGLFMAFIFGCNLLDFIVHVSSLATFRGLSTEIISELRPLKEAEVLLIKIN